MSSDNPEILLVASDAKYKQLTSGWFRRGVDRELPRLTPEEARRQFRFDLGHPVDGSAYVRNPCVPNYYLVPAQANERMASEKLAAFTHIASALGAKRVELLSAEASTEKSEAGVQIPALAASLGIGASVTRDGSVSRYVCSEFHQPEVEPHMPEEQRAWLDMDPALRTLVSIRLGGQPSTYEISLEFTDMLERVARITADIAKKGVSIGGEIRSVGRSTWRFNVEFWPRHRARGPVAAVEPVHEPRRSSLADLQPLVEAVASDGQITQNELDWLARKTVELGLTQTPDGAREMVGQAIGRFAPSAVVVLDSRPPVALVESAAVEAVTPIAVATEAPPALPGTLRPSTPASEPTPVMAPENLERSPVTEAKPGPVAAVDDAGPGWAQEAIELLVARLKEPLARLKARTEINSDEDGTVNLIVMFTGPVWKAGHCLALWAGPPMEGHSCWLGTSLSAGREFESRFDRAVLERIPSIEAQLGGCSNAVSLPSSPLPSSSSDDFVRAAAERLPVWLKELRVLFEAVWEALPRWAQLVSIPGATSRVLLRERTPQAEADPHFVAYVASTLQEEGRLDAAEEWYVKLRDLVPHHLRPHEALGDIERDRNDWSAAMLHWKEALSCASSDEDAGALLSKLAIGAYGRKDYSGSLSFFEQAHRKDSSQEVRANSGYLLYKLGRLPEAEAVLRSCLEDEIDVELARGNLALVLKKRGAFDEAIVLHRQDVKADGTLYARARTAIQDLERRKAGQAVADEDDDAVGLRTATTSVKGAPPATDG